MSAPIENHRRRARWFPHLALGLPLLLAIPQLADASARDQAKRIHDRLAGVPPTAAVLDAMQDAIENGGGKRAAALIAMDNPNFYNVTLKNWATPWTNEEQTVFAPLNDYSATVIGMVRDDVPFNQLLSADILYIYGGNDSRIPPYSNSNNDQYEAMDRLGIDLKADLRRVTQSSVTGLPASATAGIITTRAAARAFFIDGTNRAMYRFTMLNHLCIDLQEMKDPSRPSDRIRQDVSRSPGGDSRLFFNNCSGCHTGMDPLAQAYAYYGYDYPEGDEEAGQMVYTPGQVQPKYLINSTVFPDGFVTQNDHWDNYWREGPNSLLGWDPNLPGSGDGAKSMGQELANSQAFAECQVKKVFKAVCFRPPSNDADRSQVSSMANNFKSSNYNLKGVFADAAAYCAGN